jgi:hypothetical protein
MVERVTYQNTGSSGTGIVGRADFCNNDSGGASTGVTVVRNEIQYQQGWARMIDFDGTLGGKIVTGMARVTGSDLNYDSITTAPGLADGTAYSDSPIRVNSAESLKIRTCHSQAFPNNGVGADTVTFADGVTNTTTIVSSVLFAETLRAGNVVGRLISDASGDIPAGAYITAYNPTYPTQLTISAPATGSHTANTLTLGSDKACFRFMDVARCSVDNVTLTPSGGGPLIRPAVRATFSGTVYASDPVAPMLLTDFGLNPIGTGAYEWSTGSPIIEDGGGGIFRRYLKSTAFDPQLIYYYDGTNFIWANGSSAAIVTGYVATPTVSAGAVTILAAANRINNITVSATTAITLSTTGAFDGCLSEVRILDGGTGETLSWVNTENSSSGVAPLSSGASTTLPISALFQYNGATSLWRCLGVS